MIAYRPLKNSNLKQIIFSEKGASLIEVLFAVGLISILMAAMVSMAVNQSRELKALSEKMAALDMQKTLTNLTATQDVCEKTILEMVTAGATHFTFPTATPPTATTKLNLNGLYADPTSTTMFVSNGTSFSPVANHLLANDIHLTNFSFNGSVLLADLVVNFSDFVRAMKPAVTKVRLLTTVSGANTNILGCPASNPSNISLLTNMSGASSDSGVINVTFTKPGLLIATMNATERISNNAFAVIYLNGGYCTYDRSIFSDSTSYKYANAVCTRYLPPGSYNVQAWCSPCSYQRDWTIQAIEFR